MSESPSGLFPDFFLAYDTRGLEDFSTEIQAARSGREQRRKVFANEFRRFTASSREMTQAQRQTLRSFIRTSAIGRFKAFYFWDPFMESMTGFAAGSVAASSTFTVPLKGPWYAQEGQTPVTATYSAVYVGGVSKAFTVAANIGANGEDQITFTGGAQTGAVTVDCTNARERIVARFDMDSVAFGMLRDAADVRQIFQIAIKELL